MAEPKLSWEAIVKPEEGLFVAKQVAFANGEVAALFWSDQDGSLVTTSKDGQVAVPTKFPVGAERLAWGGEDVKWLVYDEDMVISPREFGIVYTVSRD